MKKGAWRHFKSVLLLVSCATRRLELAARLMKPGLFKARLSTATQFCGADVL